jgi:hypothetical protein
LRRRQLPDATDLTHVIISDAGIADRKLPGTVAVPVQLAGITGLPISECACVITAPAMTFPRTDKCAKID